MKPIFAHFCRASLFGLLVTVAPFQGYSASQNELSAAEQKQGWRLLFDGKSVNGWRSFKKSGPPEKGWVAENGELKHIAKGGGGDIISNDEFDDFDLTFEWKVAPGANSGLKYFVTEDRTSALGHEYQLIDDGKHPDALRGPKWQTGGFYDVLPPHDCNVRPPGEYNTSRILVHGNHVEHWLNGTKVLSYELGSDEVREAVAASKFKNVKGFGTKLHGHLLLQDHGDEISFRNIKILAK